MISSTPKTMNPKERLKYQQNDNGFVYISQIDARRKLLYLGKRKFCLKWVQRVAHSRVTNQWTDEKYA